MRVLILLTLVMAGCAKTGTPVQPSGASDNFTVARLFVVNGCTVYRFQDAGRFHYLSDCRGSVSTHQSCGKNCTREVEVPTWDSAKPE